MAAKAETVAAPAPVEPVAPPQIDRAAVAEAEATLDAASRDRARADDRAALMARQLSKAAGQAAVDAARARKLAFLIRDPSIRVTQASTRGGFLKGEREKLQKELSTLRQLPRPKSASILSKAPVAKPAQSTEYHFELRRNRISFINLDRLMELTRADAQVRIRMSDRSPVISNKVGPVGAFSLEYELVRAVPGSMEELLARKNVRFELSGWELLPESENRGETLEATRGPLIRIFARNQSAQSRPVDHHPLGVSGQLHPVPTGPQRAYRARLQRGGKTVAGRDDDSRQPDGNAVGGPVKICRLRRHCSTFRKFRAGYADLTIDRRSIGMNGSGRIDSRSAVHASDHDALRDPADRLRPRARPAVRRGSAAGSGWRVEHGRATIGAGEFPDFETPSITPFSGKVGVGGSHVPIAGLSVPGVPVVRARGAQAAVASIQPMQTTEYGDLQLSTELDDYGPKDGLTLDAAIELLVQRNLDLEAARFEIPMADADVLTANLRANPIFYADTQLIPYGHFSFLRPGARPRATSTSITRSTSPSSGRRALARRVKPGTSRKPSSRTSSGTRSTISTLSMKTTSRRASPSSSARFIRPGFANSTG